MARPKKPKTVNRALPEGTIIGECDCAGCGTRTPLKENSGGCVYYFCAVIVDPATKERCYSRHTFGRTASKKMIAEFLALNPQEKETPDAEHIDRIEEIVTPATEPDGEATSAAADDAGGQPAGEHPTEPSTAPTAGKRRGLSSWLE